METMTLYEIDKFGYFTGRSYTTPTYSAIQEGWVMCDPFDIPEGQYAVRKFNEWVFVDSLPVIEVTETPIDGIIAVPQVL